MRNLSHLLKLKSLVKYEAEPDVKAFGSLLCFLSTPSYEPRICRVPPNPRLKGKPYLYIKKPLGLQCKGCGRCIPAPEAVARRGLVGSRGEKCAGQQWPGGSSLSLRPRVPLCLRYCLRTKVTRNPDCTLQYSIEF